MKIRNPYVFTHQLYGLSIGRITRITQVRFPGSKNNRYESNNKSFIGRPLHSGSIQGLRCIIVI
jgi:hypothetical protein